MDAVIEEAQESGGDGSVVYYGMVLVGVLVTGTLTYSLTRRGMNGSTLWGDWQAFAAFLPVLLLEGSALALMYGRHHWFRSASQRTLGHVASWIIWLVLVANSIAHFWVGFSPDAAVPGWLLFHTRVLLPLAIVAIPILWKTLYDRRPDSQARLAVLEADAAFRDGLLKVKREQDALMVHAYRSAIRAPEVTAAKEKLFRRAAIKHAESVAGFIGDDTMPAHDTSPAVRRGNVYRGNQVVNGADQGN
jgi:hypothetical protein